MKNATAPVFQVGDVVYDELRPARLGIVTQASGQSLTVVFEDGSRAGGPGLLRVIRRREPALVAFVSPILYAAGQGGAGRAQAVKDAIVEAATGPGHTSPNPSRTSSAG